MKKILFLFFFFNLACNNDKLESEIKVSPEMIVQLDNSMNEISGILYNNENTIIGHNDSGNEPEIHEISLLENKINRSVFIANAQNLDWEDIAEDDEHIFIGDFGNNSGTREQLTIYKIKKNEYINQDTVLADSIQFHYPDQINFSPRDTHNFDCEAMIVFNDQLFLFTKNRKDSFVNWYSLPKVAGNYAAEFQSSFDAQGLITAASINESKNVIALLGYTISQNVFSPFLWLIYDFESDNIFSGKKIRLELPMMEQLEAVCFETNESIIFAGENEIGNEARWIYRLDVSQFLF